MGIPRQILLATTKEQKGKKQHKLKRNLKPATSFTFLTWFWRKKKDQTEKNLEPKSKLNWK